MPTRGNQITRVLSHQNNTKFPKSNTRMIIPWRGRRDREVNVASPREEVRLGMKQASTHPTSLPPSHSQPRDVFVGRELDYLPGCLPPSSIPPQCSVTISYELKRWYLEGSESRDMSSYGTHKPLTPIPLSQLPLPPLSNPPLEPLPSHGSR